MRLSGLLSNNGHYQTDLLESEFIENYSSLGRLSFLGVVGFKGSRDHVQSLSPQTNSNFTTSEQHLQQDVYSKTLLQTESNY